MLDAGYRIELLDVKGDYGVRVDQLASGVIDLAVFTVDSFVLNGLREGYPNDIIAVLSESTGSDGIVSSDPSIADLDDLKGQGEVKIAFTPDSPVSICSRQSRQILGWRICWRALLEACGDGIGGCLEGFDDGRSAGRGALGTGLSKAKEDPALSFLIGSESTRGLIVDVLVASPALLKDQPEVTEVNCWKRISSS